jgi:hypothetical protein
MSPQDLLRQALLFAGVNGDPQREPSLGHEVVKAMGFISPKNPKGQQEAGAGGNHTDERGSDHNLPEVAPSSSMLVARTAAPSSGSGFIDNLLKADLGSRVQYLCATF